MPLPSAVAAWLKIAIENRTQADINRISSGLAMRWDMGFSLACDALDEPTMQKKAARMKCRSGRDSITSSHETEPGLLSRKARSAPITKAMAIATTAASQPKAS